ncbi:kynurenine 3-monooxygenase [Reichenbachiella faecimaris]|uniref:Kynurenine 3-monooxygenase n=1 Tax=Reichenbachiella faecimaris TaxID=692418 RepID=A0A1W2G631_REIFA|nr:NAD(P)/FAD-dependent oxidoreductase [Reichenbachiella faecimaris]SMD32117.1 kynurenine 3-monooxygenase [Reichenbachiella faecimaris]
MSKQITIVGAGLVGSLLAALLGKRGHQVHVYERRLDIRNADISAGKSINMACSARGWKALDLVGAGDKVREAAIAMKGRMMHGTDESLTFQPYGKEGEAIYSISRAGLNQILIDHADEYENVNFYFEHKCVNIDLDTPVASFELANGKTKYVESDLIFGTDGAFSAVRSVMQKLKHFNYSQEYISHDYKELSIEAKNGDFQMDKHALHIWPRGSHMLIALPNPDGSFTCTLFLPYEGENSFEKLNSESEIKTFFENKFPDALKLIPNLIDLFNENPTSPLVIIKCFPWTHNGKVALIGDASHAIVPFYGQGMNAGFEDVSILNELLDEHGENWSELFKAFETSRKPDADAIADLALKNFIEMRDLVGQDWFLKRKKIERALYETFPKDFIPQYSMVSFTHTPYSEAVRKGNQQDLILDALANHEDILDIIDRGEFKSYVEANHIIQN